MKKDKKNLWYTRRGVAIRGPYPVGTIMRFILLGRIVDTDELSKNQIDWQLVSDSPEVAPQELKLDLGLPEHREKLRIAKLREDERRPNDRRAESDTGHNMENAELLSRSGTERREKEANITLRRRKAKSDFLHKLKNSHENYVPRVLLVVGIVSVIIGSSIAMSPGHKTAVNDCGQPPMSYVNWSNCSMEGISLHDLDLAGARLLNTKMSGAKLHNVKLTGAKLSYIDLSNASLTDSDLQDAMLMGANLRSSKLINTNMKNSDLSYAILQGADLSKVNFQNANLRNVVFNGANLTGVDFSGANLEKAIWVDNTVCGSRSIGRCIPD